MLTGESIIALLFGVVAASMALLFLRVDDPLNVACAGPVAWLVCIAVGLVYGVAGLRAPNARRGLAAWGLLLSAAGLAGWLVFARRWAEVVASI